MLPTSSRIESANSIGSGASGGTPATRRYPSAHGAALRRTRAHSARTVDVIRLGVDRRPAPEPHSRATSAISRACSTAAACTHAPAATCSLGVGHDHRPSGEVGDDALVRGRPRAAADEHDVAVGADTGRGQRVEPVEQAAHHALDRRARGPSRVVVVRNPAIVPDASGRFGVRSPSKYGTTTTPLRAGRRRERERVEPGVVDAEPARDRVGHLGRVERAHERQVAARSRRRSPRPRRSGRRSATRSPCTRCPRCRARSRRRPGWSPSASAAAMLSPVPGATTASGAEGARRAGRFGRREHAGNRGGQSTRRRRSPAGRAGTRRARREVARARRVAAVGHELARRAST